MRRRCIELRCRRSDLHPNDRPHMMGLLAPEQKILAGYALTAYKQTSRRGEFEDAWQFARIVSSRWLTIKFIGVWDTVASLIVPRPDRFYTFSLLTLPYTRKNPSVEIFRHAISIDERRRMFRLSRWDDHQEFVSDRFSQPRQSAPQDVKQVWFAGVHSDVGGGYPEKAQSIFQHAIKSFRTDAGADGHPRSPRLGEIKAMDSWDVGAYPEQSDR
jgi:uncharacterized protein (DUF2235 family)